MKRGTLSRAASGFVLIVTFIFATGLPAATAQVPLVQQTQLQLAQFTDAEEQDYGCTSIQVGRLASADGSVITCHSCDGNWRTWLNIIPHETHRSGAVRQIYWGKLHTETAGGMRGMRLKGEIPQVEETYAYMNTGYPCMNEKGLAIGETTISGRRELRNPEGFFLIENLQAIVLERCTTAREALRLIGELVKEYGYGDTGECLTFADAKEVWHFEVFGASLLEIGAVWAAVRIPDDHVGVSANIPRISELNLDDPNHYMASDNVFSLAEEMGWWDRSSGEPFKFWKAYSGRTPFSIREFFILSTMAPSLNLQRDADELPFSVKPDRKISVREVMKYYRETYEGTEYDMTKNLMVRNPRRGRRGQEEAGEQPEVIKSPLANNWSIRGDMMALVNALKPGAAESQRTIAISACSYSQVIQCRDWLPPEIGTVAFFSFDNPGQSPRMPIFAGTLSLPNSFEICGQHRFRTDSACWWFRRTNRLAMIKWGVTRRLLEPAVMEFEDRMFTELPAVEKIALEFYENGQYEKFRAYITKYTNDFAHATMSKWWELGDTLWAMFARGF